MCNLESWASNKSNAMNIIGHHWSRTHTRTLEQSRYLDWEPPCCIATVSTSLNSSNTTEPPPQMHILLSNETSGAKIVTITINNHYLTQTPNIIN